MRKFISAMCFSLCLSLTLQGQELTVIHTNDTHSHIDPVRSGKDKGLGGVIERAAFIDSVRTADGKRNVLLVDAGDFSQGTSYFSVLKGDVEIELLNAMKYDVVCIGNHEFDNGVEELARRIEALDCPVVCANYDFSGTRLAELVKPYAVFRRGGFKIGVIGLLTDVTSVVDRSIADSLEYLDPVETASSYAGFLRDEIGCDIVICLTHLGYAGKSGSDRALAAGTRGVDVIIGGHSHTFLPGPEIVEDLDGKPVTIVTDGCWGLYAGLLSICR